MRAKELKELLSSLLLDPIFTWISIKVVLYSFYVHLPFYIGMKVLFPNTVCLFPKIYNFCVVQM